MPVQQTSISQNIDYENIINDMYLYYKAPIKASPNETASFNLIASTLDSFLNNYSPLLKEHDFSKNIVPFPNFTLYNYSSNYYEGHVLNGNTGNALHLFSLKHGYKNNYFIPLEDLKTYNLDKNIDINKIALVNVQDKYTDRSMSENSSFNNVSTVKFVNVEELLRNKTLNQEEFKKRFPDYDKQNAKHVKYSKDRISNYKKFLNIINPENNSDEKIKYSESLKTTVSESVNSPLPKFTRELIKFKYCQTTGTYYTPIYSKEEHLDDMIKLYKKDPEELKSAISQAGYIMQKSLNILFSKDHTTRIINEENKKENKLLNGNVKENDSYSRKKDDDLTNKRQRSKSRGR